MIYLFTGTYGISVTVEPEKPILDRLFLCRYDFLFLFDLILYISDIDGEHIKDCLDSHDQIKFGLSGKDTP